MRNMKIAAAVAGILGAAASHAAVTAAQALAAPHVFYVAGSSAAAAGFGSAVGADLCQANTLSQFTTVPATATTSIPDFRAYSCISQGGTGPNGVARPFGGDVVTIYYRAEGGSVVGVFPTKNNTQINFLDLSSACGATSVSGNVLCTVGGTSAGNGKADNFTSGVTKHAVELGISDLEPQVFGNGIGAKYAGNGLQDPITTADYNTSFTGQNRSETELSPGSFSQSRLFQQVFGIVVSSNLTNLNNIGSSTVAAILSAQVSDWRLVSDGTTGKPVTTASTPIVICQRDKGSGTRAASDIYFEQTGCNGTKASIALTDKKGQPGQPTADNFSTNEELACVNRAGGNAIGYVSIDNMTTSKIGATGAFTGVKAVQLDGVTPSNLAAAAGAYNFAFEASANDNVAAQGANSGSTAFYPYLKAALQDITTAPKSVHVNALVGLQGNVVSGSGGVVGTLSNNIYISAYDRGGNACSIRTNKAT